MAVTVRNLTVVVGVLVALASLLAAPAAADGAAVVTDEAVGDTGRLRELSVSVPGVDRPVGVRVLLPAGHDTGSDWPLLLLLHGAGDDHRSWTERTDVEGLTAGLPFVVVMPEGGRSPDAGWYSDWVEPGGPRWESAHLDELLPLLESRYRAGGARERRVVAGLSMGGFGAMSYAARHPDRFVGAASFSGLVHTTIGGAATAQVFEDLSDSLGTPDDRVWGPYETSEVVWRGHNPTDLATNLRPVALWVRTGNGVGGPGDDAEDGVAESFIRATNVAFHDRLTQAGVAHTWVDHPGVHDWPYWEADLAATLPDLAALVANPPAPPASFDHRFVEDSRSVFGWRFVVSGRSAPAFTELTAVDGSGLTASGVGTLVATAPDGRAVTLALSTTPQRVDLATGSVTPVPTSAPPVPQPAIAALARTGADDAWLLVAAALLVAAGAGVRLSAGRAAPRARRSS